MFGCGGDGHRGPHSVARGLPRPCRGLPGLAGGEPAPARLCAMRHSRCRPHVPLRPSTLDNDRPILVPLSPMAGHARDEPGGRVARIAARQHGMVTWAQLRGAASRGARSRRTWRTGGSCAARGVYQLGVFAGPFGDEMAALLACGPHAVLSHGPPRRVRARAGGGAGGRRCSRAGSPAGVRHPGAPTRRRSLRAMSSSSTV